MFDPLDFYLLSKQISEDPDYPEQSRRRTAIGRAYYAAFLVSYVFLMKMGSSINSGQIHRDVREHLMRFDTRIGSKLESLHNHYRVPCDYHLELDIDRKMADNAFSLTEEILRSFEKYSSV